MERLQQFIDRHFRMERSPNPAELKETTQTEATEKMSELADVPEIVEERPENVSWLLAPGSVEVLVRQDRTPVRLGTMYIGRESEPHPYYQIRPDNIEEEEVEYVSDYAGPFTLFLKDGSQGRGASFTLTQSQAHELERRIELEKEKIELARIELDKD